MPEAAPLPPTTPPQQAPTADETASVRARLERALSAVPEPTRGALAEELLTIMNSELRSVVDLLEQGARELAGRGDADGAARLEQIAGKVVRRIDP
jgi:hypothetical protein